MARVEEQDRVAHGPAMSVTYVERPHVAHMALWPVGGGLYHVAINGVSVGEPAPFDDAHTLFRQINGALRDDVYREATRRGYRAPL